MDTPQRRKPILKFIEFCRYGGPRRFEHMGQGRRSKYPPGMCITTYRSNRSRLVTFLKWCYDNEHCSKDMSRKIPVDWRRVHQVKLTPEQQKFMRALKEARKKGELDMGHLRSVMLPQRLKALLRDAELSVSNHCGKVVDGAWVPFVVLEACQGIRPDGELQRLSQHPEIVRRGLETGTIVLPAQLQKNYQKRKLLGPRSLPVQDVTRQFLEKYPICDERPIFPPGAGAPYRNPNHTLLRDPTHTLTVLRAKHRIQQDELRRTYASWRIHFCDGGVADGFKILCQEMDNSESICRSHYIGDLTKKEAVEIANIRPQYADYSIERKIRWQRACDKRVRKYQAGVTARRKERAAAARAKKRKAAA